MDKVSIIVPIYNVEKYIEKCIDSVKKQTFQRFVCYLISDGSKDNSVDICKSKTFDDKRFIVIEKENGGYGSVLEYAIDIIKTDYFIVCDPDDYLTSDCLELLYSEAIKDNLDIVAGARNNIFEDSNDIKYDPMLEGKNLFIPKNEVLVKGTEHFNRFVNMDPAPHSKLYKTSLAKNIKFLKNIPFTDNMLFYLSIQNARKVEYVGDSLAFYLINRSGNTMTQKEIKTINQLVVVFDEIINQCSGNLDYLYYRLFESYKEIFYRAANCLNSGEEVYKLFAKLKIHRNKILKYIGKYSSERYIAKSKDILMLISNDEISKLVFMRWWQKISNS